MISTIAKKDKLISLSKLKSQIQSIIKNIHALEELQNVKATATVAVEKQHQLVNDTNALFSVLEVQLQHPKLFKKIKKRRNRRRRQKQIKKETRRIRKIAPSNIEGNENTSQCTVNAIESTIIETTVPVNTVVNIDPPLSTTALEVLQEPPSTVENEFLQFKNYNNAQRFLKTFELLEMLHYTRSQDKILTLQFHEQFANLRCVWNNILLENKPKRTAACRIEDQWNEAFFGVKEQTYYGAANKKSDRERLREFLRVRRTWDSYLVRQKKHGSCIPTGWILPKMDATDLWAKYRATN